MKVNTLFTEKELKCGTGCGTVATVVNFGEELPCVVYWWSTGSIETFFSFEDFQSSMPEFDWWLNSVTIVDQDEDEDEDEDEG